MTLVKMMEDIYSACDNHLPSGIGYLFHVTLLIRTGGWMVLSECGLKEGLAIEPLLNVH